MLLQQGADLGHGVDDAGNALVMVDGGDEVRRVLGDVDVVVPFTLEQFGFAVGQVGAQHRLDDAIVVGFVEFVQPGGKRAYG